MDVNLEHPKEQQQQKVNIHVMPGNEREGTTTSTRQEKKIVNSLSMSSCEFLGNSLIKDMIQVSKYTTTTTTTTTAT